MTVLDTLLPEARLIEVNRIDVTAPADMVWGELRHGPLPQLPPMRALFALRALAGGWREAARPPAEMRLDAMTSTAAQPGFQVLAETPGVEVAVGAIGKVWRPNIPFVHVADAAAFAAFAASDVVKVAWAIRVAPRGPGAHVEVEVRVDATTERAWRLFRLYFVVVGPASRFIRRAMLRTLVRRFGRSIERPNRRALPGDDLLPDASMQMTHAIDVAASPDALWPWLVQMGCQRAGFYSLDRLDNGGRRSAREIHPELQVLAVGSILPATPRGRDGFEVLRLEPPRLLGLGILLDADRPTPLPFAAPRPRRFRHISWTFVLEPLDGRSTRLYARVRGAFPPAGRWRVAGMRPVHHVMQTAQLRNLARRVEGRQPLDDWRDVRDGLAGAVWIVGSAVTPFLRGRRSRWGLTPEAASQPLPGDDLVSQPRWGWTHGIEIDAPAAAVWPWVAQLGADRGGFYSYQWLENLAGCRLRNAEAVHPEWALKQGDGLRLHPALPPMPVVGLERERYLLAHAGPDAAQVARNDPWAAASWLFLLEPLGARRCRVISRYRAATSDHRAMRLSFGPLLEPIASEMDRRMLHGIRSRAQASGS